MSSNNLYDNDLSYFENSINESIEVKKKLLLQKNKFIKIFKILKKTIDNGNKIIFFGNGGSASDAQHLATELTVRFKFNRKAISAISLATDTSALTAIGNDFGFEYIFSRQIEAIAKKGDTIFAISTSGQSLNIINALKISKKLKLKTISFLGSKKSICEKYSDVFLKVQSKNTARIQECHITVGQILCGLIEDKIKHKKSKIKI